MADDVCDVVAARALTELAMTVHLEPLEMRETTWRQAQRVPAEEAITTTIEASAGGTLYLVMDPALASVLVERLLGAEPDPALPPRPLTAIDRSLLRRVNELIVGSWDQLWSDATAPRCVPPTPGRTACWPWRTTPVRRRSSSPSRSASAARTPSCTSCCPRPRCSPWRRSSLDRPRAAHRTTPPRDRPCKAGSARPALPCTSASGRCGSPPTRSAGCTPATACRSASRRRPGHARRRRHPVQYGHVGRSGGRRAVQIGAAAMRGVA